MTEASQSAAEDLRQRLARLGFDQVRYARITPLQRQSLMGWLEAGMQADMTWIDRSAEKRLDPGLVLSGAKSVIVLGTNYWPGTRDGTSRPRWARYALYQDYHDTIGTGLAAAGKELENVFGASAADYRYYVDTGPVLERAWAVRGGLGFQGKNGMLISREFGNWLFLSTILTTVELPEDAAVSQRAGTRDVGALCGKCTRCMDACPTAAIPRPGVIDARRCISYHTIENKGIIPREFRAAIGNRIYGCDICLDVCPWNRFAQESRQMLLKSRADVADMGLTDILALTQEQFSAIFRGSPIKRVKLAGLLRNACIVAGNEPAADADLYLERLRNLARHELPMVRVHAVWAVFRLLRVERATTVLREAREAETAPEVIEEYAWWNDAKL